jgi:septal ring factor EnvC (AmiA/AmiB activator)
MLGEVRTELLERIDQSKNELRAEIQQVKTELRAEIQELRGEISEVKVGLLAVQAELHAVRADVARIAFLVEEQNARNKVVLDGLVAVIARQDRLEQRMDNVEDTVRAIASARSSG